MAKDAKTKRSAKTKTPVADAGGAEATPPKRRRYGGGRAPGQLNRKTIAMREAIASVFEELQEDHDGKGTYPHFFAWAKDNPTEFYRIAVRTLPLQIETNGPAIGVIVFRGIND